MSDETSDNVIAFRRKSRTEKSEKPARAMPVIDPGLNINTSETLAPGDNVVCRIVKYVPGGFNVVIIPQNLPAYLPSNSNHQPGDQIAVIFVAVEKNRLLLSQRPPGPPGPPDRSHLPGAGENLNCKIVKREEGGYEVFVSKYNCSAYMPTNSVHRPGDETVATFVCIDKGRFLLSERFLHGKGGFTKPDEDDTD